MNKNILLVLALFSFISYGQQKVDHTTVWNPPTPTFSQKFDWLKLRSGEWLKGDIISMYDDELEFESDKFDNLVFDWEDVTELRSRYDQQIRFANGEVKQGFLIVKNKHLVLISNGTEKHYPLSELLSITSSSENRKSLWDGKMSLGIDLSSGNVNQSNILASGTIQRRTPFTRFKVDLLYNYSESTIDDTKNVITDTARLTTYLDWFYSSKVFLRVLDYEYFSDLQQNIQSRNTLGLSLGYHLIKEKRLQWDMTLGPSYQHTNYYNTAEDNDPNSGVVALGTLLDYSISSRLDYLFEYQIQFVDEKSGKRNSHLQTGFEFEIKNKFQIGLNIFLDRVAKPVAQVDSPTPKSNDYRLVVSLGYDF